MGPTDLDLSRQLARGPALGMPVPPPGGSRLAAKGVEGRGLTRRRGGFRSRAGGGGALQGGGPGACIPGRAPGPFPALTPSPGGTARVGVRRHLWYQEPPATAAPSAQGIAAAGQVLLLSPVFGPKEITEQRLRHLQARPGAEALPGTLCFPRSLRSLPSGPSEFNSAPLIISGSVESVERAGCLLQKSTRIPELHAARSRRRSPGSLANERGTEAAVALEVCVGGGRPDPPERAGLGLGGLPRTPHTNFLPDIARWSRHEPLPHHPRLPSFNKTRVPGTGLGRGEGEGEERVVLWWPSGEIQARVEDRCGGHEASWSVRWSFSLGSAEST